MARVLPGPATAGVEAELTELLRRCAGRDRAALAELAERHGPRLRAILARTLEEPALAEAALAPALEDLWETAPYFHPGRTSAEDWVFGRVRRRAREILSTGLPAAVAAPPVSDIDRDGAPGPAGQSTPPPTDDADPPQRELVAGPSVRALPSGRVKVVPPAEGAAATRDHDRGGDGDRPAPPRPVRVMPATKPPLAPRGRVVADPDVEPPSARTRRREASTLGRRHSPARLSVAAVMLVVLVAGGLAAVGLLPAGSGTGPEAVPNVAGDGPETVAEAPDALPPPVWVPPFARPADEAPPDASPPPARAAEAPSVGPAPSGTRTEAPLPATPDAAPGQAAEPRVAAPAPAATTQPVTPPTTGAGGAVRVFIHFTSSAPQAETAARRLADGLRNEGFAVAGLRAVPFRINAGSVRYFSASDREGARRLLGASRGFLGPAARGPVDLTHYQPKPSPGTVEVWLPTS